MSSNGTLETDANHPTGQRGAGEAASGAPTLAEVRTLLGSVVYQGDSGEFLRDDICSGEGVLPAGHHWTCNTTVFFRNPELFLPLVSFLSREFPEGCPLIQYGCSTGHEAFATAIALRELSGDAYERYPIIARDISFLAIQHAASGYVNLDGRDLFRFERSGVSAPLSAFFEGVEGEPLLYRVKDDLRRSITFEFGDLTKDLDRIPSDGTPCVLFFRNAWYHLLDERGDLPFAESLFQRLAPGSVLVLGENELPDADTRPESLPFVNVNQLARAGFVRCAEEGPQAFLMRRP